MVMYLFYRFLVAWIFMTTVPYSCDIKDFLENSELPAGLQSPYYYTEIWNIEVLKLFCSEKYIVKDFWNFADL